MKTVLLSLMILTSLPAVAGEDHNHEAALEAAPHGGMLRNAGAFKTELVLHKDQAKIFVYDKDMKQLEAKRLKATATGRLAFPKEKGKRDVKFELKDGVYHAALPGIDKVHRYDLHVNLEIDGRAVLGDFGVDNIH